MTTGIPPIEMLEQNHTFPCEFVIKAIGRTEESFVGRVLHAVRVVINEEASIGGEDVDPPFSTRTTSGGRHTSVTVRPIIQRPQQVIAIYQNLQQLEGLVMLM